MSDDDEELDDDKYDPSEVSDTASSPVVTVPMVVLGPGEWVCRWPKPSNNLFVRVEFVSPFVSESSAMLNCFAFGGKKHTSLPVSDHKAPHALATGTKTLVLNSSDERSKSEGP
jgi:hypothetical protein